MVPYTAAKNMKGIPTGAHISCASDANFCLRVTSDAQDSCAPVGIPFISLAAV